MKSLYPILLIHLFVVNVFAQHGNLTAPRKSLFEAPLTGESYELKRTMGSQLFHDNWYAGDIVLISGDTVFNKEIGYNAYEDELLWKPSKTALVKLDKEEIERFRIYDIQLMQAYYFCHLKGILIPENRNIDLFARVLFENKLSLFVEYPVKCTEKIEEEAQGRIKYIEKLEPSKPYYYFRLADKEYVALNRLRKNALYGAFPGFEQEIKMLLNQSRLSLKNEDDLVRIVELMNKYGTIKISDAERYDQSE